MDHRNIANYIVILALLSGVAFLGSNSKVAEMGLFIVACALGLFFVNVERFKSFKGGGVTIETKPDKGIDSVSFSQSEKKIIDSIKFELDSYLSSSKVDENNKNLIESIRQEIDKRLEGLPELIERDYVVVDTSGFSDKKQWKFPVSEYATINEFLDDVYLALKGISPLTYNRQWVLCNTHTGELMNELHLKGPVRLQEAGIEAGMKLRVISKP